MLYLLLKWVHVLAAVAAVGANLTYGIWLNRASREPPALPFTLRGIKDSPPYMHDGRCLTIEDTIEFFNLVQGVKLTTEEKADLAAFLRAL